MFSELQTWKKEPYVIESYSSGKIGYIEDSLREVSECASGLSEIEWSMRQIVWERA